MKKRMIYLMMAAMGTVGFTGCGTGQNTTPDRPGTYDTPAGTQMGTQNTQNRTVGTTANQTATTGTSGTRTATSGIMGNTSGNTGQRVGTDDVTSMGTNPAQIPGQNSNIDRQATNIAAQTRNPFSLNQPGDYSFNNENFRFTPDQRGISITRNQQGNQTPFGTMRSFGNDGYYMVTTTNATGQEEFSVGRFDENGNFTVYSYDRNGDRVTEQNYRSNTAASPINR